MTWRVTLVTFIPRNLHYNRLKSMINMCHLVPLCFTSYDPRRLYPPSPKKVAFKVMLYLQWQSKAPKHSKASSFKRALSRTTSGSVRGTTLPTPAPCRSARPSPTPTRRTRSAPLSYGKHPTTHKGVCTSRKLFELMLRYRSQADRFMGWDSEYQSSRNSAITQADHAYIWLVHSRAVKL